MPSSHNTTRYRQMTIERMRNGRVVLCGLCGERVHAVVFGKDRISEGGKGGLSIDHIVEVQNGGSNNYYNLQPTHLRCNFEKSNSGKGIERAMVSTEIMHDEALYKYLMRRQKKSLMGKVWEWVYGI